MDLSYVNVTGGVTASGVRRAKCDSDGTNRGEYSSYLIVPIISAAAEHEHADGAQRADKDVSGTGVIITTDGWLEAVVLEKPNRDTDGEGKGDGDDTDRFPKSAIGEDAGVPWRRRDKHRPPQGDRRSTRR